MDILRKFIKNVKNKELNSNNATNIESSNLKYIQDINYVEYNNTEFKLTTEDIKLIAFYLPQFHQIPENDKWWGEGFTEWTNTKKAMPNFKDHYQPHVPIDMGYYDLTNKNVMKRQIELARKYGVYGFCFHHYWFNEKRLLEKPVDMLIENKDLNIPFCLCWANENWSRKWDGLDNEILIKQEYSDEDDISFIKDISRYFNDDRYIKINGKPVLIIYRINLLPNPQRTINKWREWIKENGFEGIYLIGAEGLGCENSVKYGLDAGVEFPPNTIRQYRYINKELEFYNENFEGYVVDYRDYIKNEFYLKENPLEYTLYKTIIPSWDNTPRRPNNSTIFHEASPKYYKKWLSDIILYTKMNNSLEEQYVFINAWNEWGEGAHLEPDEKYEYAYLEATKEAILQNRKINKKIIYVTHDTKYGGAQILSLSILKYLKEKFDYDISIVAITGGCFEEDFKKYGKYYNIEHNLEYAREIIKKLKDDGYEIAICNTVISGDLVKIIKELDYKVTTLIHELEGSIKLYHAEEKANHISNYSDTIIFPSQFVKQQFIKVIPNSIEDKYKIIPQGIFNNERKYQDKNQIRRDLKEKLKLDNHCKIVLGVGYGYERKGIDIFINIANEVSAIDNDIYFIWIGPLDTKYINQVVGNEYLKNKNLIFENFTEDLEKYYISSDLFLLTSREDPFPSVVLESMYHGLPVIGFDNAGGFTDIVINNETGFIVDFNDIEMMKNTILKNIYNDRILETMGKKCINLTENNFNFYDYIYKILKLLNHKYEKISVIVPNYNYEKYIVERIKNIQNQKYPVYEIIYLDDCSIDNSNEKVSSYVNETKANVLIDINTQNSGSVYNQWKKGIEMAKGDYIWIAEADDLSDENFLENVMNGFKNNNVILSYTQSKQIDSNGNVFQDNYFGYTDDIDKYKWSVDYINNGNDEIKECLSIKNTIPNISAVVFKNSKEVKEICGEIIKYKVAGDWIFYISLLQLGYVYFCSKSLNYHRRHNDSIVKTLDNTVHFNEIVDVQDYVIKNFDLSEEVLEKVYDYREIVKKYLNI